jgi:hypothetical protein
MHSVKTAKYIEDYKIILMFENKIEKIVDLFPHLYGEIFEPLKKLSYFKKFKVNEDTDTIEWENGADMSPDFLYRIGEEIHETKKSPTQNRSKPIRRKKKSTAVKTVPAAKRISKKSKKTVI